MTQRLFAHPPLYRIWDSPFPPPGSLPWERRVMSLRFASPPGSVHDNQGYCLGGLKSINLDFYLTKLSLPVHS